MSKHNHAIPPGLLRLPEVLQRFPVSKSAWYSGIKSGEYPKAVKIGARAVAWRSQDIDDLITRIGGAA